MIKGNSFNEINIKYSQFEDFITRDSVISL